MLLLNGSVRRAFPAPGLHSWLTALLTHTHTQGDTPTETLCNDAQVKTQRCWRGFVGNGNSLTGLKIQDRERDSAKAVKHSVKHYGTENNETRVHYLSTFLFMKRVSKEYLWIFAHKTAGSARTPKSFILKWQSSVIQSQQWDVNS